MGQPGANPNASVCPAASPGQGVADCCPAGRRRQAGSAPFSLGKWRESPLDQSCQGRFGSTNSGAACSPGTQDPSQFELNLGLRF